MPMTQDLPLISVVIPVYKVETYLDQCVESIVQQTYRNLEIILVDDGSPDRCAEMCDLWATKDSRIKVIHKKNGGLGDARNAGLVVATGDYIGFVDSDDWCEPDMFQELLESCLQYKAPVAVCNVFVDWECGWPTEYETFAAERSCWDASDVRRNFFNGKLTAWAWNKLYRKDLIPDLKYPTQAFEDIPVARNIFTKIERCALTGKCSYHYRQRQGSIVNSAVNLSQFTLIDELRKNAVAAKAFLLEDVAVARLAVSSFNFLAKVEKEKDPALKSKIPSLVEDICRYQFGLREKSVVRKKDKIFLYCIAKGLPYKMVFGIRRLFQGVYWALNMKGGQKKQ